MKSIFSTPRTVFIIAFFILTTSTIIADAQIKEVGDDYAESLTGVKNYYDRDIDFDRLFSKSTKLNRFGMTPYPTYSDLKVNMLGDSIYVWETIPANDYNTFYATNDSIKKGYYTITGYVFCTENWELVKKEYGFSDSYGESKSVHRLKEDMLRNDFNELDQYLLFIVLTSTEQEEDGLPIKVFLRAQSFPSYYSYGENGPMPEKGWFGDRHSSENVRNTQYFLYLRYYNEIKNNFIGKEVYWIHEGYKTMHRMLIDECDAEWGGRFCDKRNSNFGIVYDDLKKEKIKLLDQKYKVKDVVLTKDGRICCILEGTKTGSFAVTIPLIGYAFSTEAGFNRDLHIGNNSDICRISDSPVGEIPCLITLNFVKGPDSTDDDALYLVRTNDYDKMDYRRIHKLSPQHKKEQAEKQQTKAVFVKKYGATYGELVAKKQVSIGMTKDMCQDAWGRPVNTYATTTSYGKSEVWCYNYKTRIYFFNNEVVQIDN